MPQTTDWADVQVVGIPRALLFYRFGVLWTTFLRIHRAHRGGERPDGQGHRRWGRSSFRGRVLPGLEGVHRARGKPCGPLRRRLRALLSDERPPQRVLHEVPVGHRYGAQHLPRRQAARHLLRGAKCPEGEGRAPRLLRHGRPHGRRAQGRPRCLQGRLGRPARPRRGAGHRPGAHAAPPGRRAPGPPMPPPRPATMRSRARLASWWWPIPTFPTIRTSPARSSIRSRIWAPRSSTPTPWITSAPTRRASSSPALCRGSSTASSSALSSWRRMTSTASCSSAPSPAAPTP